MAGFQSILSDIGKFWKKVFTSPVTQGIENAALVFSETPLASILMGPAGASLMKNGIIAIENAETAAIAAGQQSTSPTQKAAVVAAQIEAEYNAFAKENNLPVTSASLGAYINALVALANSFPASSPEQ